MRRVGLLTGTFDPVHLGHVEMARAAMAECKLAEVWFLVNPEPGHKAGVTEAADRQAMVALAVAGEAGMRAGEPDRDGGSLRAHRMADFDALTREYLDTEFVYVIGADVLESMRNWEDYEPAVQRVQFAVAHRAGSPKVVPDRRLRAQMFELDRHGGASSRVIQGQLAAGEVPSELDPRVYEYIRERRLYELQ